MRLGLVTLKVGQDTLGLLKWLTLDTLSNNLSVSCYLLRRWRTNVKCLVSDGDVTRRFVSVTVNRDGPDTQLLCSFHNPASYLTTVGDQHLETFKISAICPNKF
jgi:hypothetical protein